MLRRLAVVVGVGLLLAKGAGCGTLNPPAVWFTWSVLDGEERVVRVRLHGQYSGVETANCVKWYFPPEHTAADLVDTSVDGQQSFDSYFGAHCAATGIFSIRAEVFNHVNGMDEFQYWWYVDWADLPQDPGGPGEPPPGGSDSTWLAWLKSMVQVDNEHKAALAAMMYRFETEGPVGSIRTMAERFDAAAAGGNEPMPSLFQFTYLGARSSVGQGEEGREVFNTGQLEFAKEDTKLSDPHGSADAFTPWRTATTYGGFRAWFRGFALAVMYAGFALALVVWLKGRIVA